jgi:hypothetical protein
MRRIAYLVFGGALLVGSVAHAQVGAGCTQDGAVCNDGNFCNGADRCGFKTVDGTPTLGCFFHEGNPCIGGPECNNNSRCSEELGCVNPEGTPCSSDGNTCTSDTCDGAGTCVHTPVAAGSPCADDGNPCTHDLCSAEGTCAHPNNSAPCDDGLFCNGLDRCQGGECRALGVDPCAGGSECADRCDEANDSCLLPLGTPCTDDANLCTRDQCDGLGVCAHVPVARACDDGIFCNGEDGCVAGECAFHTGDPCAGGCTAICDESQGACVEPQGTACEDDGNPCTEDLCMDGGCTHAAAQGTVCTDDANPCTDDVCENGLCTHPHVPGCAMCEVDGDCDDANPCSVDTCGADGCASTLLPDCRTCGADDHCDDGDPCTVERCSAEGVCRYVDAECFAALSCPFVDRLGVQSCAAQAIPGKIEGLVDRAGCDIEKAEKRASKNRSASKRLKSAKRRLQRAFKRVASGRGKKLSTACADGLSDDLANRMGRIDLIIDKANGGTLLNSCKAALSARGVALQGSGPSLCGKRR